MAQDDTASDPAPGRWLAVVTAAPARDKPGPAARAKADFLSQLIAERQRLPAQRRRRCAPLDTALSAYNEADRRDVPRLPPGFFRSRTV